VGNEERGKIKDDSQLSNIDSQMGRDSSYWDGEAEKEAVLKGNQKLHFVCVKFEVPLRYLMPTQQITRNLIQRKGLC
jgi:hypothetical protein